MARNLLQSGLFEDVVVWNRSSTKVRGIPSGDIASDGILETQVRKDAQHVSFVQN
jgi:hypothetical protein